MTTGHADHVGRNPTHWDRLSTEYAEWAPRAWASDEATCGIWRLPERDLRALPEVAGKDVVELGCGTAYWSAWLARRGARVVGLDNSWCQLETARPLRRTHGLDIPLVHADAERVPLRSASFDVALSEYGASIWCDPYRWIPEAARLLRPGGELVFLRYSVFLALCAPDGDGQADDRLVRDYFGLHRLEWSDDESMELALPFGEWLRLFPATGFDVLDLIELRPPAGDPLPARDQHLGAPLAEPGDLALAEAAMIRFGALLRQADNRWERIAESARICDDLGFHAIHFIDHLLAIPDPSGDILESWTTMTACATLTRRVRVSANVLCNSFRSPALLAKMGATLDVISGGRFELAMGAGWHEPEYHAYGFDFPSPGVRIAQLAEAVRLIKRLWTGEVVDFEGRHYRVRGGRCLPRPVQSPRPPIVIGGAGEKRMLRLVAEEADIWNASAGNYAQLDHKIAILHEHCRAVGRDPASLELSLQDLVVIAPTEAALQAPLADARKRLSFFGDVDAIATIGTPDRCIDTLKRKAAQGISYFVCLFTDGGQPETVRLFGEKVLPAFR